MQSHCAWRAFHNMLYTDTHRQSKQRCWILILHSFNVRMRFHRNTLTHVLLYLHLTKRFYSGQPTLLTVTHQNGYRLKAHYCMKTMRLRKADQSSLWSRTGRMYQSRCSWVGVRLQFGLILVGSLQHICRLPLHRLVVHCDFVCLAHWQRCVLKFPFTRILSKQTIKIGSFHNWTQSVQCIWMGMACKQHVVATILFISEEPIG